MSRSWASSELGATSAIVAAEPATCPAAGPTLASWARLPWVGADHEVPGLLVPADGTRRPASTIRSKSWGAITRSP
jgi:hypothetical protein